MPDQLQRTASAHEIEKARQTAHSLSVAIQKAGRIRGHSIETIQLESSDAQGTPYVNEVIPDNPLMPNIASVAEHCPPEGQRSTADWVYCPQTGIILPVVDGQSLNGKE